MSEKEGMKIAEVQDADGGQIRMERVETLSREPRGGRRGGGNWVIETRRGAEEWVREEGEWLSLEGGCQRGRRKGGGVGVREKGVGDRKWAEG